MKDMDKEFCEKKRCKKCVKYEKRQTWIIVALSFLSCQGLAQCMKGMKESF